MWLLLLLLLLVVVNNHFPPPSLWDGGIFLPVARRRRVTGYKKSREKLAAFLWFKWDLWVQVDACGLVEHFGAAVHGRRRRGFALIIGALLFDGLTGFDVDVL